MPYYAKELKKKKKRQPRNRRPSQTGDAFHIEISSDDENESVNELPRSPSVELFRSSYKIKKHTKNPYFSCF